MAALIEDNVRRLMSEYTFEIDNNTTNEDIICLFCNKIMIDAHQSHCGCNYCECCIINYLSDGDKYCCGGKQECSEDILEMQRNVFKSAMLNRKISRVKVICPNEWCTHSSDLTGMEQHLRVCMKQSIECPYVTLGCDNDIAHNDPLTHTQLLIEHIHGLKNELEQLKDNFDMSKLEITTLKKESILKETQMEEQKKDIEFLKEELRIKEIQMMEQRKDIEFLKEALMTIERQKKEEGKDIEFLKDGLTAKKIQMKKQRDDIEYLKKGSTAKEIKIVELIDEVTNLKNDIKLVRVESRNIKNTVAILDGQWKKYEGDTAAMMTVVREGSEERERRENDGLRRVDGLEATIERINIRMDAMNAVGTMVFTVDKYSVRKTSADCIYSPYFYTHTNGYKLRLRLWPGGRVCRRDTQLSVYIVFCVGEYDDQLLWPCKHTFTVSIVNQMTKETHISETLSYSKDPVCCKHLYNKPTNQESLGHGYDLFISHEELRATDGVIVDDCVIFKCVVTAPS